MDELRTKSINYFIEIAGNGYHSKENIEKIKT